MPKDEHDLDALDASWEEPKAPTPTPTPDVGAVDDGWDSIKVKERHKTGAERAAARKAKALARAERQRSKAAAASQKQKQKQKPKRAERDEDDDDGPKPARAKRETARAPSADAEQIAARKSWIRMLVAVGVIIAVAAFVLFVLAR